LRSFARADIKSVSAIALMNLSPGSNVYYNSDWYADSGIRYPDSNGQMQPASLLTFLFVYCRIMPIVRQLNGPEATIFQGPLRQY